MGIPVKLKLETDYLHVRQIVTGFIILHRAGVIDLSLSAPLRYSDSDPRRSILEVEIDGRSVIYDVADDYYLSRTAAEAYLERADLYFKRSFDPRVHESWKYANRLKPLGLNYHVEVPHRVFRQADRRVWRRWLRSKMVDLAGVGFHPYVKNFECQPEQVANPVTIFMARLWDPRGGYGEIPPSREEQESRAMINDTRVECIRLLRAELGPAFVGGLEPNDYSMSNYPDLVTDKFTSSKKKFLDEVHRSSICVATTGLGRSIGWKMAEYVAASKAIVSERLNYVVPGNFTEGQNYLTFATPSECVEKVVCLMNESSRFYGIQLANRSYYERFLRPDALVQRTIEELM